MCCWFYQVIFFIFYIFYTPPLIFVQQHSVLFSHTSFWHHQNVFGIADRTPEALSFAYSPWIKYMWIAIIFVTYCSYLCGVNIWQRTEVFKKKSKSMRKDCLVYGVLPHEKRLSGLLGFTPWKKTVWSIGFLPYEKRLSGPLCFTPWKKTVWSIGFYPTKKTVWSIGFYPTKKTVWSIGFLPMKKDWSIGFYPMTWKRLVYWVLPHEKDCLVYWVLPQSVFNWWVLFWVKVAGRWNI